MYIFYNFYSFSSTFVNTKITHNVLNKSRYHKHELLSYLLESLFYFHGDKDGEVFISFSHTSTVYIYF